VDEVTHTFDMNKPLHIGPLPVGARPLVVGVISSPVTIDRLASGFRPACDIAEFRADLFGVDLPDWLIRAGELERTGLPVLFTVRHKSEGGHWYRSEQERVAVYRQTLPYVAAIDVELRAEGLADLVASAHEAGRVVVGSHHDFNRLPEESEILSIIDAGRAQGVDIVKIAALTRTPDDLVRLEAVLRARADAPLCVLGMGACGPESRVRLARAGSCLTYGFVDESVAPGQLSSAELQQRLRP